MSRHVWMAAAAYVAWGLFPFYWKQVDRVPAAQVMSHRVFWSFVTLGLVAAAFRQHGRVLERARSLRVLFIYGSAAAVISGNWLTYIWSVNQGDIVQTSLGYFINPLVSVLLGVVIFGERLRRAQWTAVALASAGVAYLTVQYGGIPWVALILAVTFAVYGAIKKVAPLQSMDGLTIETAIAALPAAAYLAWVDREGSGSYLHAGTLTTVFLTGAGIVTTIPLALFARAVQVVPLTMIGLLQYIAPTLQLMAGVLVYNEPFTRDQAIGFGAVWAGLAVFAWDGFSSARR